MERTLRREKIVETAARVQKRIEGSFPGAGLAQIGEEIVQIAQEAVERAEAISRPNRWLRAGLALVAVVAACGLAYYLRTREGGRPLGAAVLDFLDAVKGDAAILAATAVFLVTLETRLKRRRALKAVHELRAVAHLIDMHQLTKSPDRLEDGAEPVDVAGRPIDATAMVRYLHFCTELLAVLSKVGQLYVQDFPDPAAQTAVDHFESLAGGLSGKIWQKLMILDRVRAPAAEGQTT